MSISTPAVRRFCRGNRLRHSTGDSYEKAHCFRVRDIGRRDAGAGRQDEDRDGGFEHGGWTIPYWHDDIGKSFFAMIKDCDAFLLGRRTYVTHAEAFEPMASGDPFGDAMNTPRKYVVSKTLEKPIWRNTTNGVHATFGLVSATSYPTGVVGLHYARQLEQ